jgi:ANTAR domain
VSRSRADERDDLIVRRAERGWVVGQEKVSDLTSAMVLADLFAADHAEGGDTGLVSGVDPNQAHRPLAPTMMEPGLSSGGTTLRGGPDGKAKVAGKQSAGFVRDESTEAERLAVTVAQLEHALASRVRVEQAIGILAERHRLRPREAFDLLRKASRARGRRVTELANDVVESTANPLLRLPDELARTAPDPRQREPRQHGRSTRRGRHAL